MKSNSNFFYRLCRFVIHNKKMSILVEILRRILGNDVLYQFFVKVETSFLASKSIHSNKEMNTRTKLLAIVFDDRRQHEGLADNLRAIVSVFQFCKLHNIDFKILYNSPFCLNNYLEPNQYDWTSEDDIVYIDNNSREYVCLSYRDIFKSSCDVVQLNFLNKIVLTKNKVVRLYTNLCCYDDYYSENFMELFKPSPELQRKVDEQLSDIGCPYISVSFRFAQLLGDLQDTFASPLSLENRKRLIEKCINAIRALHEKESSYSKILVTSDSVSFIECAQRELDYIYTIPGVIGHVGRDGSSEVVMKTFLDMYMIANASKVFMIRTENMFKSGFAKRAAMITNKHFEEILIS